MTSVKPNSIKDHPVVSPEDWLVARKAFLAKEKEFTRLRDELNRQRRELPWVKVDKTYTFDGPDGRQTLAELFGKQSQLLVYHFMFDPDWDEGCPHCSFWAEHFDGAGVHLNQRDAAFVAISRAPLAKITPFKQRMGWKFKWLSSFGSDFNYDYYASFTPEQLRTGTATFNYSKGDPGMPDREGISVFYKDEAGTVYHTYSSYARGIDLLNGMYNFIDLTPKGRDEDPEDAQSWVRYHDRYTD
jgi:predicted dithiol-disulfide oxidoreductase (DUF899 family)